MKKVKKGILVIFVFCLSFLLVACGGNKDDKVKEDFLSKLSNVKSYKANGILESFYDNNKKQSDFEVFYKEKDLYKVILKANDSLEEQIILKNNEGVNILVPSVNKNFKIKSSWPNNASYPYLLQSLASDIANDENKIIVNTEEEYSIECKVKLHADANGTKQKIIFDKETKLPKEVLIYDKNMDLFMRCLFISVDINCDLSDSLFELEDSMKQARLSYGSEFPSYENRACELPGYYPASIKFVSKDTVLFGDNARTVMKFANDDKAMSLIFELIDDSEEVENIYEDGDAFMVMNTAGVITKDYICFIYEGILYTIATSSLEVEELVKVAATYMISDEK